MPVHKDAEPTIELAESEIVASPVSRRRSARAEVRLALTLKTAEEVVAEYSENLSQDGVLIRSEHPLPKGAPVSLDLNLPYRAEPLALKGRVARALPHPDGGFGLGIALEEVPPGVQRELQAFLVGYREGIAYQSEAMGERTTLLVGMRKHLGAGTQAFLRRGTLRTAWASSLLRARAILERQPTKVMVVWSPLLDEADLAMLVDIGVLWPDLELLTFGPPLTHHLPVAHARTAAELEAALARSLRNHKRMKPRVPLGASARVQRVDGTLEGVVENLSQSGIGLLLKTPCAVGERIVVRFRLPGQTASIEAAVRVMRASAYQRKSYFVGGRFLALGEVAGAEIEAFLSQRLAK